MKLNKYINLTYAIKDDKRPVKCRCKHYSFIVYKNKLLSIGFNNPLKTHPLNLRYKYKGRENNNIGEYIGVHSELSAILKYGFTDCTNHILVNTRLTIANNIANSKPCGGCQNLLKQLNFKKVYYTNNSGKFELL